MSNYLSVHHCASDRSLIVDFESPQRAVSWAPQRSGFVETNSVVWCQVANAELGLEVDPLKLLSQRLVQLKRPSAVAFLTSADISQFTRAHVVQSGLEVTCIATVGFGNALRVGDPPISPMSVGTINILCHVSTPLTDGGLLEVMSLVAEARTVAVLAHRVRSTVTGQLATGTGTDCIAVSCPATGAEPTNYAGKHTLIGHLVGQATLEAVSPC